MTGRYRDLIRNNLDRIHEEDKDLGSLLPALRRGRQFLFRAFGQDCLIQRDAVLFSGVEETGPRALLVTLYALHGKAEPVQLKPFRAFKDFPGSMPYHGAFSANSERVLVPHVAGIRERQDRVLKAFDGERDPEGGAGDFSLLLYPLPKIALCYIFYGADEDFPASATCLFSSNARAFLPLDGLADVAEYTSREVIGLVR